MITHNEIRKLLYDYCSGTLEEKEKTAVEEHLRHCSPCTREANATKALIDALPVSAPSSQRNEEFWKAFSLRVESRIVQESTASRAERESLVTRIMAAFQPMERELLTGAGILAVVLFALIVWMWPATKTPVERAPVLTAAVQSPEKQVGQYFRKTRALLVGLDKIKQTETGDVDLSEERKVSRELLNESRMLRKKPIDIRSARVMDDLDRILVSVANAKDRSDQRDLDLVRGGIRSENLMFKVRMAEIAYRQSR